MPKESGYYDNKYFSKEELKCKGSGDLILHPGFLGELIQLRRYWAAPLYVNCCCRSPEHNEKVGGAKGSYHLTEKTDDKNYLGTMAIDIGKKSFASEDEMQSFAKFAEVKDWSVGLYDWGVHIDRRIMTGATRVTF